MLTHTFCHIPGIGRAREDKFWSSGIHTWNEALRPGTSCPCKLSADARRTLAESPERLANGDASWFARNLPRSETWRLSSHFARRAAFVDIETTSGPGPVSITTMALYDGKSVRTYVRGRNLVAFRDDIRDYPLMVTFNRTFTFFSRQHRFLSIKSDC